MANTISQSGAQSATITIPTVGAPAAFGTAGAADWAELPSGKLKDLLNQPYGAGAPFVPNFSTFFAAAADAGFSSVALTKNVAPATGAHTDIVSWDLDASGYPIATVVTADPAAEFFLRIQVSYSASE